jgi:hypothetical protein
MFTGLSYLAVFIMSAEIALILLLIALDIGPKNTPIATAMTNPTITKYSVVPCPLRLNLMVISSSMGPMA